MDAPNLSIAQRFTLVAAAAAAFVIGLWPTWAVRDAVLSHYGSPAYEGVWTFIPHALLYSTLPAIFCLIAWFVFARLRWLTMPAFFIDRRVIVWGLLGGVVAIAVAVATLFAIGQGGAFHAPTIDPWLMAGNAFSNFYEELVFRGFILAALAAALGSWPAAILSSIAFGAVHTQYPLPLQIMIGALGLCWCMVLLRAKSLLAPYLSHMTLDWLIDPFL